MAKSNLTTLERFMRFVSPEPNSGCWLWMGAAQPREYGLFSVGCEAMLAHRVCYELFKGPIPEGLELDHKCRVHCCVNPDHMEPVTHQVNCKRGLQGDLYIPITHCKHGHELAGDNLGWYPSGYRRCLACTRIISRRSEQKRRAVHAIAPPPCILAI